MLDEIALHEDEAAVEVGLRHLCIQVDRLIQADFCCIKALVIEMYPAHIVMGFCIKGFLRKDVVEVFDRLRIVLLAVGFQTKSEMFSYRQKLSGWCRITRITGN